MLVSAPRASKNPSPGFFTIKNVPKVNVIKIIINVNCETACKNQAKYDKLPSKHKWEIK